MFRCFLVSAALILAGMGAAPMSAATLNIDPRATDMGQFRVVVSIVDALKPAASGDVDLTFDGMEPIVLHFDLRELSDPKALLGFKEKTAAGRTTHMFALAPVDVEKFERMGALMRRAKAENRHGSFSFKFSVNSFCTLAPLPKGALFMDSWVFSNERTGFEQVEKDNDLRFDSAHKPVPRLDPPCAPV